MTPSHTDGSLRVATLGGPATFAGQATSAALDKFQRPWRCRLLPDNDTGVGRRFVARIEDIGVLGAETSSTGLTEIAERLIADDSCSVLGEVVVPYRCMLLGKPGASIEQIRLVVGHGSLTGSLRRSLNTLLPNAELRIHRRTRWPLRSMS